MEPVAITDEQAKWWTEHHQVEAANRGTMGGPEEAPDVLPCPVIVGTNQGRGMVGVIWQLNEVELAQLAKGGKLWLTTYGGLPIHLLEVQPPEGSERCVGS